MIKLSLLDLIALLNECLDFLRSQFYVGFILSSPTAPSLFSVSPLTQVSPFSVPNKRSPHLAVTPSPQVPAVYNALIFPPQVPTNPAYPVLCQEGG